MATRIGYYTNNVLHPNGRRDKLKSLIPSICDDFTVKNTESKLLNATSYNANLIEAMNCKCRLVTKPHWFHYEFESF